MRDLHTPIKQLLHQSNLFYSWWYMSMPILNSDKDIDSVFYNIDLYNKIIKYIMIKHPEMKKDFKMINVSTSNENQKFLKAYNYTNDNYRPKIQIFDDLRLDLMEIGYGGPYNPPTYDYLLIYNNYQINSFNINGWTFTHETAKKQIKKYFYYIMNYVLDYAISHPFTFDLSKVNINYICNYCQSLTVRDESSLFTGKSRYLTVKNMKTLFNSHIFTGKTDFMNGQLYQDILLEQFEKFKDEYIITNYGKCDDFIHINLIHKNNL